MQVDQVPTSTYDSNNTIFKSIVVYIEAIQTLLRSFLVTMSLATTTHNAEIVAVPPA